MAPVNIHQPDPNHPKGMAWILGVGIVDHRPGNRPNQPTSIVQTWEPTSELYWDLGLRWHPELATKWATGGGQFSVANIVSDQPEPEKPVSLEDSSIEILEEIAKENPQYAAMLRTIRESGSIEDREKVIATFEGQARSIQALMNYLSTQPKE